MTDKQQRIYTFYIQSIFSSLYQNNLRGCGECAGMSLVSYPTDGGISIGHSVPSVGGCDPSQLGLKSSRPYCHFMGALKMQWHRK